MKWHIKGNPFDVQRTALERSEGRAAYAWFMEQGLGKTPVALNAFEDLAQQGKVTDMVVIAPNSLKGNWEDEARKWESSARIQIWDSPARWNQNSGADVHIFNYECCSMAGGDVIENLLETRKCLLVLDESQRIKNPNSTVTRRVLGHFAKYARYRRALSGTPMTNTVLDFWSQLRFAGALSGSNPIVFKNRYGVSVAGFKGHKKLVGVKNEDELRDIINGVAFRALKIDWAKDLPDKLYREPMRLELPGELRAHYQTMLEMFIVMLDDDRAVLTDAVAGQYLKLQQISSGFIYDGDNVHTLMPMHQLPKFKALMDVIEANGNNSKTLVFAHFRPTCQKLLAAIEQETGEPPAWIVGGMRTEDVRAQKDAFNSDTGPRVMVLQLSAGKEGHTLLGGPSVPCHTSCYFENSFNLGDRLQSEDRNHRYGQKNPVLYVDFTSSPVETHVIRAYQKKKKLVEYLIDNKEYLTKGG
jgi:SNF2 family DNA or RNA helicase